MKRTRIELISQLEEIRNDPIEREKCRKDPLYFHNKYVKDPDIPNRTQEEFEEWKNEVHAFRLCSGNDTRSKAMFLKEYPIVFNKSTYYKPK